MNYASIVGYGYDCPKEHIEKATELSSLLVSKGFGGCAGGYIGIFKAVFEETHRLGAPTLLFTDPTTKDIHTDCISTLCIRPNVTEKHDSIVQKSDLLIVIGGGKGSEMLAEKFQAAGKKVFAVLGTGGAADTLSVEHQHSMEDLRKILQEL